MKQQEIIPLLENLEQQLKTLLDRYEGIKSELKAALGENKFLKEELRAKNEELKNFQNQDKISKIVSSIAEDTQRATELKLKINEYIKEIDKCIAGLSE